MNARTDGWIGRVDRMDRSSRWIGWMHWGGPTRRVGRWTDQQAGGQTHSDNNNNNNCMHETKTVLSWPGKSRNDLMSQFFQVPKCFANKKHTSNIYSSQLESNPNCLPRASFCCQWSLALAANIYYSQLPYILILKLCKYYFANIVIMLWLLNHSKVMFVA